MIFVHGDEMSSHPVVLAAIRELTAQMPEGFSVNKIAETAGVSRRTAQRAITALANQRCIKVTQMIGYAHRYEVLK